MSEGGFVVSLFPSARFQELDEKGQRVFWKAVNFITRLSCRLYHGGKLAGGNSRFLG
jgi:hypothetical protein